MARGMRDFSPVIFIGLIVEFALIFFLYNHYFAGYPRAGSAAHNYVNQQGVNINDKIESLANSGIYSFSSKQTINYKKIL